MYEVRLIINMAYTIMNINITLYGYTFSLWQVCLYSMVAALLLFLIFRLMK